MSKKIEARVALCKCQESKKIFGIRMEKTSMGWKYDWAFKISESRAQAEGYENTSIMGMAYPDPEYPGCPYCKGDTFVVCYCKRLTCSNSGDKSFTCGWCGAKGEELVRYSGSGIESAGDI